MDTGGWGYNGQKVKSCSKLLFIVYPDTARYCVDPHETVRTWNGVSEQKSK